MAGEISLRTLGTLLRGEKTDPDSLYLRTGAPEAEKLFHVSGAAGNLAGDRAVDGHEAVANGVENSLVGGRFAALIMLRLQARRWKRPGSAWRAHSRLWATGERRW